MDKTRILSLMKTYLLTVVLCAMIALQPCLAFADMDTSGFEEDPMAAPMDKMNNLDTCTQATTIQPDQITTRIVFCVRTAILAAVKLTLRDIAAYMSNTITIAIVVAVAVFGIRVAAGETELNGKTLSLGVRLGLVYMFTHGTAMTDMANRAFDVTDWLITLVTPPNWTPWEQIDGFLGRLFGFADGATLVNGVMGVVFAAALSATAGVGMFASALLAFFDLMMFVMDIVYAYLTALLIIGFMLIVSPIIIPLALFNYSERFFKKWLNNIIGAMILPMMLFGFLSIALDVFETLISDAITELSDGVKDARGNPSFEEVWRLNQSTFEPWLIPSDPNRVNSLYKRVDRKDPNARIFPALATEMNPHQHAAEEVDIGKVAGAKYNYSQLQSILLCFISLWIYAHLMKELIRKMPDIAQSISGASLAIAMTGNGIGLRNFKQTVGEVTSNLTFGTGAMLGGFAGQQVGAAVGGFAPRSAGTIAGMVIGGHVGENVGTTLVDRGVQNTVVKQISKLTGRR